MFQTQPTSQFLRHHFSPRSQDIGKGSIQTLGCTQRILYNIGQSFFLEAWRKWSPLRIMNYKSIAEFNSAVPKICCKLQFCDQIKDNEEIIKKTLSIFSLSNR